MLRTQLLTRAESVAARWVALYPEKSASSMNAGTSDTKTGPSSSPSTSPRAMTTETTTVSPDKACMRNFLRHNTWAARRRERNFVSHSRSSSALATDNDSLARLPPLLLALLLRLSVRRLHPDRLPALRILRNLPQS